jgi:hypothetical protein
MKADKSIRILAALFALAAVSQSALASELACPAQISVDQKATDVPAGWTPGYNGIKNELAGVTIFDGPPEQGASLAPDTEKTVGNNLTQTWTLAANGHGSWLTCRYSNTSAELTEKLPDDATHCVIVFERDVSFGDGRHPVRKAVCGSK